MRIEASLQPGSTHASTSAKIAARHLGFHRLDSPAKKNYSEATKLRCSFADIRRNVSRNVAPAVLPRGPNGHEVITMH